MRISKLYYLIALLSTLLLGAGCQTAQRSEAILPAPQANAPALTQATQPPPQPPAAKPAPQQEVSKVEPPKLEAPAVDPVAETVAKAEKEYQAGKDAYTAGNLEAARKNFDNAFNLLLSSPQGDRLDS